MFSSRLERRRKFRQLGIVVAVTVFVVGGGLLAICTKRGLDMLQVAETDHAPFIAGVFVALAALGVLCLISYYAVRAIGSFGSR